jgi:hypothetical protein
MADETMGGSLLCVFRAPAPDERTYNGIPDTEQKQVSDLLVLRGAGCLGFSER